VLSNQQPAAVSANGLPPEGPARPGDGLLRLALVVGQLLLLLLVVRVFELENRTVFYLLAVAVLGFAVHASLRPQHRLPFFSALSVASIVFVLGLKAGMIVLGLGFMLIGVCHLPFAFKVRVGILLVLAAVLMVLRTSPGVSWLPRVVGPVLGSLFMFRLALYLHSVRHRDAPHGLAWSTAYLFMLPNVCFPLFPVVDYNTFVRTHFDADRFRIYDRGIRFMVRGIVQLLAYRLVYYQLALDDLYLNDLGDVIRYVISTFLLYIKVSGQFWVIIGLLGLYGFRLPETNHLYFLASSPTDFWRRINIYWKDFMMKLVYYPSFFRLRRYGNTIAVAAATLVVFAATWLLHAYQAYWLLGSVALLKRDIAFWGTFAVLVLVATLWELRPGRRRVRKTDRSWSFARGTGTVTTFALIAVLWSLWNAKSLGTWLFMWTRVRYSTPADWYLLLVLAAGGIALAGFGWGAPTLERPRLEPEPLPAAVRRFAVRGAALGCLVVVALPRIQPLLPARLAEGLEHARGLGWSPAAVALYQVGYYEQLTKSNARVAVPWHEPVSRDHEWQFFKVRGDFLLWNMPPSKSITFMGARFSTNSWGMRGREYGLAKPPSTYRVALFGPSDVLGWGVADSEVFETLVEAQLDSAARTKGQRAEVLNFAIAATSLAQQVFRVQEEGLRFSPDLIVLTVHPQDLILLQWIFRRVGRGEFSIPDSAVAQLAARVGVGRGSTGNLADLRLIEEELDRLLFRRAQELGSRVGARVAILALRLLDSPSMGNLATTRRAIAAAGVPLIDCTGIWDGRSARTFRVSDLDAHPNAAGHRLIADCLFDGLARGASTLGIRPLVPPAR
jgi:hypothetical protein